jgi:hypothetical protein
MGPRDKPEDDELGEVAGVSTRCCGFNIELTFRPLATIHPPFPPPGLLVGAEGYDG